MELEFSKKRDRTLITPCCGKSNKDGKFVSFKGYESFYGYCHSCGETNLPTKSNSQFKNDHFNQGKTSDFCKAKPKASRQSIVKQKYIHESIIWDAYLYRPENNLIRFLKQNYPKNKVEKTLKNYTVGSDKLGGTIFWYINEKFQVQKAKIFYYDFNGKRKNKFRVPYKNKDGYEYCLFGQHILTETKEQEFTVVLVESEKTALTGDILFPEYIWLAYSGINGLTDKKIEALKGQRVVIIPDISKNAVNIINKKLPKLKQICKYVNILDLRNDKTDEELKREGVYNDDLEDIIRKIMQ